MPRLEAECGWRNGCGPARCRPAWLRLLLVLFALLASVWQPVALAAPALPQLRQQAIELLNAERRARGLPTFRLDETLNRAAEAHAADMAARGYYAHLSPEGRSVMDRYVAAGGERWSLVAENIANCPECRPPVLAAMVERLHRSWMDSPDHRDNMLNPGLDRFGFGIVARPRGGLYAVQTFAGPGQPRTPGTGEAAPGEAAADPRAIRQRALDLVNATRRDAGVPLLAPSAALATAAATLLPARGDVALHGDILETVPAADRPNWRLVSVLAGACGGCGAAANPADIAFFQDQWLGNAQYRRTILDPAFTHLGFALQADGSGRKVAAAMLGQHR